jgi:hypothetical protein
MSWTDTLGKITKGVVDFTGIPGLIHDVSNSLSNNDPWYTDGLNIIKDVAKVGTIPLRGAVQGLLTVGQKSYEAGGWARQKIEQGILDTPLMYNKFKNADETFDQYKQRVAENKDKISLGETALSVLSPGKNAADRSGWFQDWTDNNLRFMSAGFDLFNPDDRKVAFNNQYTGKFISGMSDAVASTVIDPLTVTGFLGKGAVIASKGLRYENINGKLARAVFGKFAATNESMDQILTKALVEKKGQAWEDINFLAKPNNAVEQAGYWADKKVTNPDAMAYLFGRANSPEEVVQTFKAVLGKDTNAMAIIAEKDPEAATVLDAMNEVPHPHKELLNGNLAGDILISPEYNKAIGTYVADLAANDTRYRLALNQVATGGTEFKYGFERGFAKGGAIKAAQKEVARAFGEPTETIIQKTSLHPAIRVVNFFSEERPSGVFNVNDANSYRDFNVFLREANDLSKGTFGAEARAHADNYLAAQTPGERLKVIAEAEQGAINNLFPGFTDKQLKDIYQIYDVRRANAIQRHQDQGFISYFEGDHLQHAVSLPVLRSESANTVIIADLRKLKFGVDAHMKVLPTLLDGADIEGGIIRGTRAAATLDTINDIFKTSVLMRLGYTTRNLAEAQLSMLAKGFALPSVVASGGKDAVDRFFNNRKVGFSRLSDHVNVMLGRRDDIKVMQNEFAQEGDKLRSIEQSKQYLADAVSQRIAEIEGARVGKTVQGATTEFGAAGAAPGEAQTLAFEDEIKRLKGVLADLDSHTLYHGSPYDLNIDPSRGLALSASPGVARRYAESGTYHSVEQYIETPSGRFGRLGEKPVRTPGAEAGTPGVVEQMPLEEFKEIKDYVRGFYAETQQDLRDPNRWASYGKVEKSEIPQMLQRAIQRSVIKKNTVVFRGTSNPDILNAKLGDIVTEKGFVSTSKEYKVAEGFAAKSKTDSTVVRIQLPKGANGLDIIASYKDFSKLDSELIGDANIASKINKAEISGEKEVLLPAGTKFEVVNVIEGQAATKDFPAIKPVVTLRAIVQEAPAPSAKRADVLNEANLKLQSDMIDAVNAGRKVEYKDSVGNWRKVKHIDYNTLVLAADTDEAEVTLFGKDRWSHRPVFRVNYSPGNVEPVRVYGKPLNLLKWTSSEALGTRLGTKSETWGAIPADVKALFENKASNFNTWVKTKGWQDQNDPIYKYMRENGYGRMVVPDDRIAGGVTHIALPEAIGGKGRVAEVKRSVQTMMDEAQGAVLPLDQKFKTPEERRAARKAFARQQRSGVKDIPVSPYYHQDNIQAIINNGIEDAAENLSRMYAQSHAHMDDMATRIGARIDAAESMAVKQRLGYGNQNIIDANGHAYSLPKVFQGASWFLGRTSAEQTWNAMVSSQEMAFTAGIGSRSVRLVQPSDPRYFEGWANILNMHFRNPETGEMDPVVERIIKGADDNTILRWFKTNEGSTYANDTYTRVGRGIGFTAIKGGEKDEELLKKIRTTRGAVKAYIPDAETADMLMTMKAEGKPLTGGEVQKFLVDRFGKSPENLTPLNGLLVTTSKEYKDQERIIDTINRRVMRFLGSLPEDVFARHPLASAVYDQQLRRNIAAMSAMKGGEELTAEELNRAVRAAREKSRTEVEKTLFTIVRRTGASSSQTMKLLFPFYAAFENTAQRWGGMVAENPAIAANTARTIAQVVNGQMVVDQNGNEIKDATKIGGNANLIVRVPQGFIDSLPKSWRPIVEDSFKNISIPLSSLDVITQGQPGNPGVGPFAVLPAYLILKQQPSLENALSTFFPAGMPQSATDLFTPPVIKRLGTIWKKDELYVRTFNQMLRYETYRFNTGERTDAPTVKEVTDRTNKFYLLRAFTSLTMPFAVSPEVDFYRQQYLQLQQKYADYTEVGPDGKPHRVIGKADAEFLKMYPDYFEATVSLSKNPGGLEPSLGTVANLKKFSNLMSVAQSKGDPELIGFLANDGDNKYTFSQAAYQWEYSHGSAPGSGSNYLQNRTAGDITTEANIKKGWTEFQALQKQINTYKIQNGITSDTAPEMQKINWAKQQWLQWQAKNNLDWYSQYAAPDRAKYARRAEILLQATQDPKWMAQNGDRTVVKNMVLYLDVRQQIQKELEKRYNAGGSRSLTANKNGDLAWALDQYKTQLIANSPETESFFNRYFANDTVVI